MTLAHRRFTGRIAILAILLNALMPGLSQLMVSALASGAWTSAWTEICTPQGARWLQLGPQGEVLARADHAPQGVASGQHGPACGYCVAHAGSFALPPVLQGWQAPRLSAPAQVAGAGRAAPRPALAWAQPAVRAPPQG